MGLIQNMQQQNAPADQQSQQGGEQDAMHKGLMDMLGAALLGDGNHVRIEAGASGAGVLLLAVSGWVAFAGSPLDSVAAAFLLLFLLTKFLRVLLFSALVSLRLRQEADQARQAMAERAADSRALITHLGAGVVVLRRLEDALHRVRRGEHASDSETGKPNGVEAGRALYEQRRK